jgi:GTP-binding protein
MVDVVQGISQVDQKLGKWFSSQYKPCVIVVNKWDLAEDKTTKDEYDRYIRDRLPGLSYAPLVYTSVREGMGVDNLYDVILEMRRQMDKELGTKEVNDVLHEAQQMKRPRQAHGSVPKLYYTTQIKKAPPTFLIFGKSTQRITDHYRRFLGQFFRKHLKMKHMPMRFVFRNRESQYKP